MSRVVFRDFDAEIEAEARAAARAAACRFTQDDLDAAAADAAARAYALGREAGEEAGREAAEATLAARQVAALEAIGPMMARILDDGPAHRAALESQLLGFVLSVCERVFPAFMRRHAPEAAAAAVRRALSLALDSPRLTIRLSPATHALLAGELAGLADAPEAPAHLDIAADPALTDGAAEVRWQDGYMEYNYEAVCTAILRTLRAMAAEEGAVAPAMRGSAARAGGNGHDGRSDARDDTAAQEKPPIRKAMS